MLIIFFFLHHPLSQIAEKTSTFCFPFAKKLLTSMNWFDHIFYLIWSETRWLARLCWQTGWTLNRYLFGMVYNTSFHRLLYYLFLSKSLNVGLRCQKLLEHVLIWLFLFNWGCHFLCDLFRYRDERLWTRSHYSFFFCLDWTEGITRDSLFQTLAYLQLFKVENKII